MPLRIQLAVRSEEHTSELQSLRHLVCRLLLEKKKNKHNTISWSPLLDRIVRHAPPRVCRSLPRACYACSPRSYTPVIRCSFFLFFFFNDTATTEIYTLSLHDALPIWLDSPRHVCTAKLSIRPPWTDLPPLHPPPRGTSFWRLCATCERASSLCIIPRWRRPSITSTCTRTTWSGCAASCRALSMRRAGRSMRRWNRSTAAGSPSG